MDPAKEGVNFPQLCIILNFEGEAEGTSTDEVIAEILKQDAV